MRVLVAGSTGYLGQRVVRELHSRGHGVRALARSDRGLANIRDCVDEVHFADATDRAALRNSCRGVDAVFSAIGLVGKSKRQTCWDVDYQGNVNILEEALVAGVSGFVYTSVIGAPVLEPLALVRAKRAFEDVLRRSGIPHTILRPNGYFSDMESYLAMARRGRGFVFGNPSASINPVDGADVALCAVDALEAGGERGDSDDTIEFGGPEVLTHEEILRSAFAALGEPATVTHLPRWSLQAGRTLFGRATPLRVHQLVEFPLAVLAEDLIAPTMGMRRISDHFAEAARR